ncbi:hypothetical protein CMUS01_05636 [Colletotrichum musicola]|uniref:Uncharacterized protein n=1 Tax=Colletotrichum musicola TaxID=2175873 RepID=A0A8H6KQV6_9PEZI|nr:hypothetical protein CMUS01_05636 [Colletotrichum musicola]
MSENRCSGGEQMLRRRTDAQAENRCSGGGATATASSTTHEYKRFEAAEVRRQVREAPPFEGQTKGYPKEYHNDPSLPLTAEPQCTEYPIVPTAGGNYRRGRPGPVRAFYNDSDRENFDLAYHDDSRPPIGPREGRDYKRSPFSLARYHPGSGSGQQKESKSS